MGKLKLLTLSITVALVLITGCAPVYVPSSSHTHLMQEKGELSTSVHTGTNGIDAQAAYAFLDQFAIVGAASFEDNKDSLDNSKHHHSYFEVGVDYFNKIGKGRFEVLVGYGFGNAETVEHYSFFGPKVVMTKGLYSKFFVQNNIGVETRIIDLGIVLKLSQVSFSRIETTAHRYNKVKSATFLEPAIFARAGWKNLKFESQFGFSEALQKNVIFNYPPYNFSIGIQYQFKLDSEE